jgi:hypothetical protein
MNRFEKEILEIIDNFGDKSSIEIRSNADYVFRKLQDNFPVSGSKIDWDNVHPRENLTSPLVPITTHDRIKFFSDNIDKYCLIGRAFLIGDSILDFAMEGTPVISFLSYRNFLKFRNIAMLCMKNLPGASVFHLKETSTLDLEYITYNLVDITF